MNAIKSLACTFTLIAWPATMAIADDNATKNPTTYTVHDLSCQINAKVNKTDMKQCTYHVPKHVFDAICIKAPIEPTNAQERTCILKLQIMA